MKPGDGTTTNRSSPVQVTGLSDVTAIAAGYYHTLALPRGLFAMIETGAI